jgi:hypothetical protein
VTYCEAHGGGGGGGSLCGDGREALCDGVQQVGAHAVADVHRQVQHKRRKVSLVGLLLGRLRVGGGDGGGVGAHLRQVVLQRARDAQLVALRAHDLDTESTSTASALDHAGTEGVRGGHQGGRLRLNRQLGSLEGGFMTTKISGAFISVKKELNLCSHHVITGDSVETADRSALTLSCSSGNIEGDSLVEG